MQRAVVTGMGVVSPIGRTVVEFFDALLERRSGIRAVPASIYSGPSPLVAALVDFNALVYWPAHQAAQYDRATQFALVAADQALRDAALNDTDETGAAGVYWGTGLGGA